MMVTGRFFHDIDGKHETETRRSHEKQEFMYRNISEMFSKPQKIHNVEIIFCLYSTQNKCDFQIQHHNDLRSS